RRHRTGVGPSGGEPRVAPGRRIRRGVDRAPDVSPSRRRNRAGPRSERSGGASGRGPAAPLSASGRQDPVAPGADMAMHVALARALWAGAHDLSPAWPGVAPLAYPRGFSGLVALFWGLGPARAGILASALAYVLYALGARRL